MKQRNVILTMIFAIFCAKSAAANTDFRAVSIYDAKDAEKIEEANVLLGRLAKIGALEIDENENIRIKKSVLDKLKEQGRVQEFATGNSIVCD